MRNIGYYNGKIGPLEEMTIPMDDRAVYFGDGIYDVSTILKGKFFAVDHHIDRFFRCCEELEMPLHITKEEFRGILNQLKSMLDPDVEYATFYYQASRGIAPRNHIYPKDAKPTLLITLKANAAPDYDKKATLITHPDVRFQLCHIKTLNLIPNVMASQRAAEAGVTEAVLHKDGRVTECAHSGLAFLKNGTVVTTPLSCEILPSITRAHLVEICKTNNIPLEERDYTLEELREADEVLVLATSKLFMPAVALEGKPLGGKDPALLGKLRSLYFDYIDAHLTDN